MARVTGLEPTRRIRADENESTHIPIVALTANASEEDRQACLAAGMDVHVKRPFTEDDLLTTLRQLHEEGLL